jgi:hypothetical protein
LQRYERVNFEYDYHLLKRWLLKMSYNSARIHNSIDLFAYPGKLPPDRLGGADLVDAPSTWEPQDNRCGHMYFNVAGVGQKVLRAVHLRSYSFFLAFFEPGGKSATLKHFTETFLSIVSASALLLPTRPRMELFCDGMDAWDSIDGARENRFVRQASKLKE